MAPKAQKGKYNYFVLWNHKSTGGRFYESNIVGRWDESASSHMMQGHDGDRKTFTNDNIFMIGCVPKVNDDVIAYWDNRGYAFLGKLKIIIYIISARSNSYYR